MARYYYEDAQWPWRPDGFLRRFLRKKKQIPRFAPRLRSGQARDDKQESGPRALDLGMGYGRNALWLAERGYKVEGWETDRRYRAEARREARLRLGFGGQARRRTGKLIVRRGDFTRARFRGPYDVIVVSNALHQVRRSAALRTLQRARAALAPGGRLFLLVKLTRDRYFQRIKKDASWAPVPRERNTLRRRRVPEAPKYWRGRKRGRRWTLSALTPQEIRTALRGSRGQARGRLRILWYREAVLRSDWQEPEPVTHDSAEAVAEKERK